MRDWFKGVLLGVLAGAVVWCSGARAQTTTIDPAPTYVQCSSACTVQIQVSGGTLAATLPDPSVDDYAAAITVFTSLLGAGCAIWGMKALYRQFRSSPDA